MEEILKKYNEKKLKKSDINEHLPTIKKYCDDCEHITEMGVRDVVSTWAIVASKPKKIISYDIVRNNNINEVQILCEKNNIDFTFHEDDSLKCEIELTDLLLIDTLHTYNQLINELKRHSNKVKKYIILHDTISFGYKDENIYNHASVLVKNIKSEKQGLNNAITDFLTLNKNWKILETFKNNNGLTILIRK